MHGRVRPLRHPGQRRGDPAGLHQAHPGLLRPPPTDSRDRPGEPRRHAEHHALPAEVRDRSRFPLAGIPIGQGRVRLPVAAGTRRDGQQGLLHGCWRVPAGSGRGHLLLPRSPRGRLHDGVRTRCDLRGGVPRGLPGVPQASQQVDPGEHGVHPAEHAADPDLSSAQVVREAGHRPLHVRTAADGGLLAVHRDQRGGAAPAGCNLQVPALDAGTHRAVPAGTDGERCHLPLEGDEQAAAVLVQRRFDAALREHVLHEPPGIAEVHVRQVGVPRDAEERILGFGPGSVPRRQGRGAVRPQPDDHRVHLHVFAILRAVARGARPGNALPDGPAPADAQGEKGEGDHRGVATRLQPSMASRYAGWTMASSLPIVLARTNCRVIPDSDSVLQEMLP